jgi:hypothetical protein
MSKVIINQEHVKKIKQMTKFIMYDYTIEMSEDNYVIYTHQDPNKSGEIYWLEHVVYHLAKKILNRDDASILQFHISCLTTIFNETSPFHPINYLYERFIRNKENKEKQLRLNL